MSSSRSIIMSGPGAKDSDSVWRSVDPWPDNWAATCGSSAPAATEAASKSASGTSVLVVEDEATARKAIERILRQQNFSVLEAGTLAEGLAKLTDQPRWVLLGSMPPCGA